MIIRDAAFIRRLYREHCGTRIVGDINKHRWVDVKLPYLHFRSTGDGDLFTLEVNHEGTVIMVRNDLGMCLGFHNPLLTPDPFPANKLVQQFLKRHGFLKTKRKRRAS